MVPKILPSIGRNWIRTLLRAGVTGVAILLLVIHLFFPDLRLDASAVFLVVIAALPWLPQIVRSIEFPGGFKIEVADIKAVTEKILGGNDDSLSAEIPEEAKLDLSRIELPVAEAQRRDSIPTDVSREQASDENKIVEMLRNIAPTQPRIALVELRNEIENRLLKLARAGKFIWWHNSAPSSEMTLLCLVHENLISVVEAAGFRELIALGNAAANGVPVSPEAIEYALNVTPQIFGAITNCERAPRRMPTAGSGYEIGGFVGAADRDSGAQ